MKTLRAHQVKTVRRLPNLISSLILVALASVAISAQQPDPSIKTTQVFGKVSEINSSAGQITIKTAAGSTVVASVHEKTTYQRMPPCVRLRKLLAHSSTGAICETLATPLHVMDVMSDLRRS